MAQPEHLVSRAILLRAGFDLPVLAEALQKLLIERRYILSIFLLLEVMGRQVARTKKNNWIRKPALSKFERIFP